MDGPPPTPLAALDLNFWKLDTPNTHQAIASLCVLETNPDFTRIQERWLKLLDVFPRLRCRVEGARRPVWQSDPDFRIDNHLEWRYVPGLQSFEDLCLEVGRAFSERLDLDAPPWRFIVFSNREQNEKPDGGGIHAAMLSTHHSLADGLGLYEVLQSICDSSNQGPRSPFSAHLKSQSRQLRYAAMPPMSFYQKCKSAAKIVAEAFTTRGRSPLNGPNSDKRELSAFDVSLDELKEIKAAFNVAVNDVLLAIVAGGARNYTLERSCPIEDLRAIMPVNMRLAEARRSLGNHLTGVGIRLPLTSSDPLERLLAVADCVTETRAEGAYGAYAILGKINSRLPSFFHNRICELQARKTNFICTNVPGPQQTQYIAGAKVQGHYGLAALMRDHGVAFAFISYTNKVHIALASDPAIVADPNELMRHCRVEAKVLLDAARVKNSFADNANPVGRELRGTSTA